VGQYDASVQVGVEERSENHNPLLSCLATTSSRARVATDKLIATVIALSGDFGGSANSSLADTTFSNDKMHAALGLGRRQRTRPGLESL
jgi:hypothetical protein